MIHTKNRVCRVSATYAVSTILRILRKCLVFNGSLHLPQPCGEVCGVVSASKSVVNCPIDRYTANTANIYIYTYTHHTRVYERVQAHTHTIYLSFGKSAVFAVNVLNTLEIMHLRHRKRCGKRAVNAAVNGFSRVRDRARAHALTCTRDHARSRTRAHAHAQAHGYAHARR